MKWKCPNCDEVHEEPFDSCWKCGTVKTGERLDFISEAGDDFESATQESDMPCATTPNLPGRSIVSVVRIVSGEAIMGANFFRDFAASITDFVGGRSHSYETKLREGRAIALQEMRDEARNLGADAIVGIAINYETVGQSMFMVIASGTAVKLEPQVPQQR